MTNHNIGVPDVIGTVRLGPQGIEELDELLERAYQAGRDAAIAEFVNDASEYFIQYGHMFTDVGWMPEYKGKNYATHQRAVFAGPIEPITNYDEPEKTVRDVIEENGGTTPTVQGWA